MLRKWVSIFFKLKKMGYANDYQHNPRLPGV
jgi:hypothetical protein